MDKPKPSCLRVGWSETCFLQEMGGQSKRARKRWAESSQNGAERTCQTRFAKGNVCWFLKEILEDLQFPDKNLFCDIITGFRLSGWMRDSKVSMSLPRPSIRTLEALLKSPIGLQKPYSSVSENLEMSSYTLQLGRNSSWMCAEELHLAAWKKLELNVCGSGSGRHIRRSS